MKNADFNRLLRKSETIFSQIGDGFIKHSLEPKGEFPSQEWFEEFWECIHWRCFFIYTTFTLLDTRHSSLDPFIGLPLIPITGGLHCLTKDPRVLCTSYTVNPIYEETLMKVSKIYSS